MMEKVYETPHFYLSVDTKPDGAIDGLIMDVLQKFDIAQEGGYEIWGHPFEDYYDDKYDITPYLEKLGKARNEEEKDDILLDLYLFLEGFHSSFF